MFKYVGLLFGVLITLFELYGPMVNFISLPTKINMRPSTIVLEKKFSIVHVILLCL